MATTVSSKRRRVGEDGAALRFRNYVPVDEELKKVVLPAPKVPSEVMRKALDESWSKEEEEAKEAPLNIAPRKPNFDLKRDVQTKMERLNLRTQVAIADIIRAKLSAQAASGEAATDESSRQLADAVMKAGTVPDEDLD